MIILLYQYTELIYPNSFLKLFIISENKNFDKLLVKNLNNFLKFGNKNIQNTLYNYLEDPINLKNFSLKLKNYIKTNKNIILD